MSALLANLRPPAPPTNIASATDARLFDAVPLNDALSDALLVHASPDARPRRDSPQTSDFSPHTYSYDALNQFIASGQWRALALASAATITKHTDDPLRLWTYRALALRQLQCSEQAERELHRLSRVVASRTWPFELRLLRACLGAPAQCIARLSVLLRGCRRRQQKITDGSEMAANGARMFRLSLLLAGQAMLLKGRNADNADSGFADRDNQPIASLGNVQAAERQFVKVESLVPASDRLAVMNRALFAMATGKWAAAKQLFASVNEGAPPDTCVAANNNMALCELYLGSPSEMLASLQKTMAGAPTGAGTAEPVVFNYCTGLDLHYDGARLRDMKARTMAEVGKWAGDGFDVAAFKMQ
ncbi:hypothetical protein DL89DRAFT_292470 [Linderina pennispora]|uniref:TPR-like protein n=1 Tax=Linderina pennispora TaxID=61395 RepID=A0A1Y1WC53_9FUNG|nr:uncharacterized protein DL89DRAFT_292470 [Linderina pennispora]ORX70898.1 hypothetical protein DL89DRAFT_292470 [Linderina pennispora]